MPEINQIEEEEKSSEEENKTYNRTRNVDNLKAKKVQFENSGEIDPDKTNNLELGQSPYEKG